MVTGTRGKSGTVRLIHAALSGANHLSYAKITGTTAVEIDTHGVQTVTPRFGSNGVPEMRDSLLRATKQNAEFGIFECMAVSPALITLVQKNILKAETVVIPTIRLDHLEDEGITELQIGQAIIKSVGKPKHIITGVTQPEILAFFRAYCIANGINLIVVNPTKNPNKVNGHHPVNLALALAVGELYGATETEMFEGLEKSTFEPETKNPRYLPATIMSPSQAQVALLDLGGANDPESSAEAVQSITKTSIYEHEWIPVLINRWDRPLRAVSFVNAVLGGSAKHLLIVGTLFGWTKRTAKRQGFETANIKKLSWRIAKNPEKLINFLHNFIGLSNKTPTLVTLENTHDMTAEALLKNFENNGISMIARNGKAKNA
jgi:poly-gamma-glutamate synthase PgsB/CapB